MEFMSLSRRRSSARNVPATKKEEKRMFSQAKRHPFREILDPHLLCYLEMC